MEFKVNIGDPKSKKTLKKVFSEEATKPFIGKRIGIVIKGELIGFPGYEFEVTGGSDYCGFPMRRDVQGIARKKVLTIKGFGNFTSETVQDPKKLEAALNDLEKIIGRPHFKTKVGKTFKLEEINEAMEFSAAGGGKAVISL